MFIKFMFKMRNSLVHINHKKVSNSSFIKMISVKNKYIYLFLLSILLLGCQEEERVIFKADDQVPQPIENLRWIPTNGGFDISYDLPPGKDILYVVAEYTDNKGQKAEVRTSTFNNKIAIRGFGDTGAKTVEVFTVDRAKNKSIPTRFTAEPLTPVVEVVAKTISILPTFGGVSVTWLNETELPIVLDVYAENEDGELEIVEVLYSENIEEKFTLRGRESTPQKFRLVVKDRYENQSSEVVPNTPDQTLTPFTEDKLDKSLFSQVVLDNDDKWDAWGSNFGRIYNDNYSAEDWAHTQGDRPRPSILSLDLGVEVELSRFKLYQRGGNWGFRHANPKTYTLYGSLTIPGQDGNLDDWIKIRDCESIKPSGLPVGTLSNEDRQAILNGDEFEIEELVRVRYIRLAFHTSWGGNNATHLIELDFWGKVYELTTD